MFELTDLQIFWLIGLLILWAGLLFGGFALGKMNADRTHRTRTWQRMASSFVLVLIAWTFMIVTDTDMNPLPLLFALGMTFGFIGDLFMARLIIKGENFVLGGIAAFSVGHLFYIAGMYTYGSMNNLLWMPTFNTALLVWLVAALIGWFFVVYYGSERTVMHLAALPYTLLLATTAGFATGLALQEPDFTWVAVGAALFLLSDLLLAAQLFRNLHFRSIGDAVWFMYGPGQMLIVCGLWLSTAG